MAEQLNTLLPWVVLLACLFSFVNGWNDARESLVLNISNRTLRPKVAIGVASISNFVGAFLGFEVARTIAVGLVDIPPANGAAYAIIVLLAPITWVMLANRMGIPVSSTHSLAGSLFGMSAMVVGWKGINWQGAWAFVQGLVLAPLLVIVASFAIMFIIRKSGRRPAMNLFTRLHMVSSIGFSLAHGSSSAQKAAGMVLFASLASAQVFPANASLAIAISMGAGTLLGGLKMRAQRRIPRYNLDLSQGAVAQTVAAVTVGGAAIVGIPLSATQVITSAIYGTASVEPRRYLAFGLIWKILVAWAVTLPICFGISAFLTALLRNARLG